MHSYRPVPSGPCLWAHLQAFQWAPNLSLALLPLLYKDESSYMDLSFPQKRSFLAHRTYGLRAELCLSSLMPDGGGQGWGRDPDPADQAALERTEAPSDFMP